MTEATVSKLGVAPEEPDVVAADALAAMTPGTWMTATQIHQRMGRWSIISTRHALRDMTAAGQIETRLDEFHGHPVREYRKR